MRFEWDEAKRLANIAGHGLDFVDVESVFASHIFNLIDDRFDYGEIRFFTLGILRGQVVAVSHTENDEVVRVISFRKGLRNEEKTYYDEIAN